MNSGVDGASEQPLGILPHQIRGSLSQFSQMTLVGRSSDSCTACSSMVSYAAHLSRISNLFLCTYISI